jgi:peptidoglycan/LPS O-acetylase OafA/YrhL
MNKSLDLIDGIAIISIVLLHSFGLYNAAANNIPRMITNSLYYFGLAAFSLSAGYKLAINHGDQLGDKGFLRHYFKYRAIRLYKPYIGYTILVLPFLYLTIIISRRLNLDYAGLHVLDNPINGAKLFIIGENPVAYHLWFLVTLLTITTICLTILYAFNISALFRIAILGAIIWPFAYCHLYPDHLILYRIITFGIIFIGGIYAGLTIELKLPNVPILQFVGKNSFYIFLFQGPFLMTISGRIIMDFLGYRNIILPFILTAFTILASIVLYRVTVILKINGLFE